ncbi:hypothetical protein HA402_004875 [Bradysia odoriphaga]|nr:hypothetical protein HA402_004875 [Bradysia odoriphaga]
MCDQLPCLPEGTEIVVDFPQTLDWYEYLIFGGVLALSMAIGVYYGCFGTKNKTNEEFLMAGRSMSILPVALSLVCSFVSAITLLGNPVEVYFYGQQYTVIFFSFIPMTLVLAYLYVPVYFDLQLTSAYQYFEWRFSRPVRTMCTIFAIIHLVVYMPITVLGPSLALDQVAGFNYIASSAAIFLVCIAYSSIGGLKAVLWTDALQAGVMVVALAALAICGIIEVGGLPEAWQRSLDTGRINFFNFDPDPRGRHTFWSGTIGGFFVWLPLFGATQAQIQRYNSVPTLRQSRKCLAFNMVGMTLIIFVCSLMGMLIFAKYHDCDPVGAKIVSSADQLLPLFVVDALRNYPTLPGLLVAGLTCGTLSTVSSALNSLTALITEDFVKHYRPQWDEIKLGYTSKIISTVTGLISFALVFVVRILNRTINISPFSTLIHGSLIGPILGAFTLGMFLPWVNNTGILLGMFVSILFSGFIGLGNIIAGIQDLLPNQRLNLTVQGCTCSNGVEEQFCRDFPDNQYLDLADNSHWKENDDSVLIRMFSISYIWQPGVGTLSTIVFGIFFSALVILIDKSKRKKVHAKLLSKPFIRLWNKIFGKSRMDNWIDYDDKILFVAGKSD